MYSFIKPLYKRTAKTGCKIMKTNIFSRLLLFFDRRSMAVADSREISFMSILASMKNFEKKVRHGHFRKQIFLQRLRNEWQWLPVFVFFSFVFHWFCYFQGTKQLRKPFLKCFMKFSVIAALARLKKNQWSLLYKKRYI